MKRWIVLLGLLVASTASATPTVDQLFQAGLALMSAGKPAEACEKFTAANQIDPDAAGVMLNLGLCNEQLAKFKTALFWFRRAQVRAAETSSPDAERVAKEHTTDLASKIAIVRIAISPTVVPGTVVKIDGEVIATADYARAEIDPGRHQLVATAPDVVQVQIDFDASNTTNRELEIRFEPIDPTIEMRRQHHKVGGGLMIGGGALLAGAAAVGIAAKIKYDNNKDKAPTVPSAAAATHDAQQLASHWGTGLAVAGAVVGVTGAIIFATAPRHAEHASETALVPTVAPDRVGLTLLGRF